MGASGAEGEYICQFIIMRRKREENREDPVASSRLCLSATSRIGSKASRPHDKKRQNSPRSADLLCSYVCTLKRTPCLYLVTCGLSSSTEIRLVWTDKQDGLFNGNLSCVDRQDVHCDKRTTFTSLSLSLSRWIHPVRTYMFRPTPLPLINCVTS